MSDITHNDYRQSAGLAAALINPIVVFVLFSGSFAFWHLPGPYRAALHNDFIHALEHLSFFLTSLAFWTLVIQPSGRRPRAMAEASCSSP